MQTVTEIKKQKTMTSNSPMIPISVVAGMLNVHQRTLRIYDSEKILSPTRSLKNRRLYSMDDIQKGLLIQFLTRELGLNIAAVKIIMHLLKSQNINAEDHIEFIKKVAESVAITSDVQAENKVKFAKRGRRKNEVSE